MDNLCRGVSLAVVQLHRRSVPVCKRCCEHISRVDLLWTAVHRCGLKTVINLQRPGEHASCGNPLEQESGFTYRPEIFMEAGGEFIYPPVLTHYSVKTQVESLLIFSSKAMDVICYINIENQCSKCCLLLHWKPKENRRSCYFAPFTCTCYS